MARVTADNTLHCFNIYLHNRCGIGQANIVQRSVPNESVCAKEIRSDIMYPHTHTTCVHTTSLQHICRQTTHCSGVIQAECGTVIQIVCIGCWIGKHTHKRTHKSNPTDGGSIPHSAARPKAPLLRDRISYIAHQEPRT